MLSTYPTGGIKYRLYALPCSLLEEVDENPALVGSHGNLILSGDSSELRLLVEAATLTIEKQQRLSREEHDQELSRVVWVNKCR